MSSEEVPISTTINKQINALDANSTKTFVVDTFRRSIEQQSLSFLLVFAPIR